MKSKLSLALRRNKGKQLINNWITRMTDACGDQVRPEQLLPLEQTEALKSAFTETLTTRPDLFRQNWSRDSLVELACLVNQLGERVPSIPIILFSDVDQYLGAIQLSSRLALARFIPIWEVVGEDFRIASLDIRDGLCVGVNFHDLNFDYHKQGIIEVAAWGVFANIRNL